MVHQTRISLFVGCIVLCLATIAHGQENDPTAQSDVINKTLSKIRDVERLDSFVEQNKALKAENAKLKADLASIKKQLDKLTADFAQQNVTIRKQLLQMPTFQVLSKVISGSSSMALLKMKTTNLKVKANTKLSVPVADGTWVLMEVREISKDMIVLYFPELQREVFLYD